MLSAASMRPVMMKVLRQRYGEAEAVRRWKKIEALNEKWILEEGDLGGRRNMMASNILLCYAFCAFYETVDRQFTHDEFNALAEEVLGPRLKRMALVNANRLYKKRWLMALAHRYIAGYKKKVDRYRGNVWGNTWALRVNPDGHEAGLAMTLDTCPLYEFAQKHGYMEILPWMCALDHKIAAAMHARLIRHKTLSAGDDCCEYWYVGDRSPEALADTGSK